jgi:hypothetical protein
MADLQPPLCSLHDATLTNIVIDWQEGIVTLKFRGSPDPRWRLPFDVIMFEMRHVDCPRLLPWGPSESVNELRGPLEAAAGTMRFELEMQSGDVIVIEAARWEVRRVG